jgi:hypothetical protein
MDSKLKEVVECILDYLEDTEERSYLESDDNVRDTHIYEDVVRLRQWQQTGWIDENKVQEALNTLKKNHGL